jgi:hypothetical protein
MSRRLFRRLTTTFCVVLSLLFAQLALANYVCPAQQTAAAMAETMAAGEPCEGMDAEQPALCAQFSAGVPQSLDTVKVPAVAAPLLLQLFVLPFTLQPADAQAIRWTAAPLARPPPAAVFLATLRLRV